nr:hypothetical protein B11C_180020 [Bartonella sp. 1-1C]
MIDHCVYLIITNAATILYNCGYTPPQYRLYHQLNDINCFPKRAIKEAKKQHIIRKLYLIKSFLTLLKSFS